MIIEPIFMPPAPQPRRWKTGAQGIAVADQQLSEKEALPAVDTEVDALKKQVKELKERQDEFTTKKLVGDVAVGLVAEQVLTRGYNKLSETQKFKKVATKVGSGRQNIAKILRAGVARIKSLAGTAARGIGKAAIRLGSGLRFLLMAAGIKVIAAVLALSYLVRLGKRLYEYKTKGLPPGMTGKQYFYNSLIPFKGLPSNLHGPVAQAIQQEPSFRKQMAQMPKEAGADVKEELAKIAKQKAGKLSKAEKEKVAMLTLQRAAEAGIKLKASKEGIAVTASDVYVAAVAA